MVIYLQTLICKIADLVYPQASRQHHAGDSSKADTQVCCRRTEPLNRRTLLQEMKAVDHEVRHSVQGKAPASSGGLAAPAVRGHISPARAADDKSTPTLVTTQVIAPNPST